LLYEKFQTKVMVPRNTRAYIIIINFLLVLVFYHDMKVILSFLMCNIIDPAFRKSIERWIKRWIKNYENNIGYIDIYIDYKINIIDIPPDIIQLLKHFFIYNLWLIKDDRVKCLTLYILVHSVLVKISLRRCNVRIISIRTKLADLCFIYD